MIEEYLHDDGWMKEVIETPSCDRGEPPMKKPCSGLRAPSLPSLNETSKTLQEEPRSDNEYEILHNEKQKPRKSSTPTRKNKGKAMAQLRTLFDRLPTEIIYMIFSHVHPSDLLQLARTGRMLRSHLMSRSSASVWKEVREEAEPPVPDCPPDQSEPQWANLLFSRDCSTCERTGIYSIDWNHRLRLCSRCNKAGVVLIVESKARKIFPDILDVKMLLDLLPHSNGRSSRMGKYYRMTDIEDIGAEWVTIKEGSEAEIRDWKNRKKREAEDIVAHGTLCKTWDRDRIILNEKQRNEVMEERRKELSSRLEALGHHPEDVPHWTVSSHSSFYTSTPLTEKRWEAIRPALEAVAEDNKARRLQMERERIINQRQFIAISLLKTCQVPSDIPRAFQKPLVQCLSWPPFSFIINQPNEVSVTTSDFQPALDELPNLFAHTASEVQADLLRRMLAGGATDIDPSSLGGSFHKLHLATSVFWCQSSHNGLPVCGIDNLSSHRCRASWTSLSEPLCLYYDQGASNLVATLLATANLDPSTTAEQMDGMDLRFHCPGWANQPGRLAMNWRDAVRTYKLARWFSQIDECNQLRSGPWEMFSAEETALIKEKEMANIKDERSRFRCNTCANAGWIRRRELENHLEGCHSIVGHPNPTAEFHLHPRRPPQPLTFDLSENIGT